MDVRGKGPLLEGADPLEYREIGLPEQALSWKEQTRSNIARSAFQSRPAFSRTGMKSLGYCIPASGSRHLMSASAPMILFVEWLTLGWKQANIQPFSIA